jgi:hypothetical protein
MDVCAPAACLRGRVGAARTREYSENMNTLYKLWIAVCGLVGTAIVFAPIGAVIGVVVWLFSDFAWYTCVGACAALATIGGMMLPIQARAEGLSAARTSVDVDVDDEADRPMARKWRGPFAKEVDEPFAPVDSPFISISPDD